MDEFRAGVTASLRSWSALRTAVETGWGGSESVRKAEVLRSQLFQIFNGESVPPKGMADLTDLEDALAIFMEEEFSVVLEDGSERQLADCIWKMYEACVLRGDVQMATQAVTVAESALAKLNQGYFPIQIVVPENTSDSDSEDDDGKDAATSNQVTNTQSLESSGGPDNCTETVVRAKETTSTVTDPLVPDENPAVHTTAANYAAQPLFATTKKRKMAEQPAPRQLGETPAPEAEEAMVDEDGFAHVTKQKRRSRSSV